MMPSVVLGNVVVLVAVQLPGQILMNVMALEHPVQEVQNIPLACCLELQYILELILQNYIFP